MRTTKGSNGNASEKETDAKPKGDYYDKLSLDDKISAFLSNRTATSIASITEPIPPFKPSRDFNLSETQMVEALVMRDEVLGSIEDSIIKKGLSVGEVEKLIGDLDTRIAEEISGEDAKPIVSGKAIESESKKDRVTVLHGNNSIQIMEPRLETSEWGPWSSLKGVIAMMQNINKEMERRILLGGEALVEQDRLGDLFKRKITESRDTVVVLWYLSELEKTNTSIKEAQKSLMISIGAKGNESISCNQTKPVSEPFGMRLPIEEGDTWPIECTYLSADGQDKCVFRLSIRTVLAGDKNYGEFQFVRATEENNVSWLSTQKHGCWNEDLWSDFLSMSGSIRSWLVSKMYARKVIMRIQQSELKSPIQLSKFEGVIVPNEED